jgi:hypothetical protein
MYIYNSVVKNDILLFMGKWMELEIILSKISQTQKGKYHVLSHMQTRDLYKKLT